MRTLERQSADDIRQTQARYREEPARAERHPHLVAEWSGGDRSVVRIAGKELAVNGPGQLGPMQLILAALAACEIDVVALHAALAGIAVEGITVEADGHFDVRRYVGLEGPGPGYDRIAYRVLLRTPGATDADRARLAEALERASPVGNTLSRRVELVPTLETAP